MKIYIILLATIFTFTTNTFSQVEFITHIITPSPDATTDNATYVLAVDVDDDGDMDIVSSSWLDNKIAWYENDGNQKFVQHTISTSARGASWLYAIDMDRDQDVDILSSAMLDNKVYWYKNDGHGSFTTHVVDSSASLINWGKFSVYAHDVDSDGDMDALSGSWDSPAIEWHENDGNQNFTTHLIQNQGGHSSVYAIDMDEDGDADVLSASQTNDTVAWYENDGNQNFTTHVITNGAGGARTVKAVDLDEDGDMDVLTGCWNKKVEWYENDGSQNFSIHTISSSAYGSGSIYVVDVDNDSDLDILSSTADQNMIAWMENDGEENFSLHIITTGAIGADTVFGKDMDGDGDIDVLSAGLEGDQIAWYENVPADTPFPNTTPDTERLILLNISSGIDTTFFVYNTGNAVDSVFSTISDYGAADSNSIFVSPAAFELAAGDSMGVSFTILPTQLAVQQYLARIHIRSKYNRDVKEFEKIVIFTIANLTAIEFRPEAVPKAFALLQNYPNPFNPTTVINYDVPASGQVELKIFNTIGQGIRTLVNSTQPIGTNQVVWDGRDGNGNVVPSGVYFYQLQAGSFVQTRKMVLMK